MDEFKLLLAITSLLMAVSQAGAHGEDRPGPNGGFIQMPGAFHTEVVPLKKNQVAVYLLDMNWKDPRVSNSSVTAVYMSDHKTTQKVNGDCAPAANHFVCNFTNKVDLTKAGKLVLETKRNAQQGNPAIYKLPLKHE
ncbi:MAG: hypothetical protein AB7N80_04895 [Bdellovibrionales bacterium]